MLLQYHVNVRDGRKLIPGMVGKEPIKEADGLDGTTDKELRNSRISTGQLALEGTLKKKANVSRALVNCVGRAVNS